MVKTPFYRTQVDTSLPCTLEPDVNYTPADLFRLRTRLDPYLRRGGYGLRFGSVKDGQTQTNIDGVRMIITVDRIQNDRIVPDNDGEFAMEVETAFTHLPTYALVYDIDAETRWPVHWVRSVSPYLEVPSSSRWEGDVLYLQLPTGNVMVDLPPIDEVPVTPPPGNYKQYYDAVATSLQTQLAGWWQRGVHVTTPERATQWSHRQVPTNGGQLYEPTWVHPRLMPTPVEFWTQLEQDEVLRIPLGTASYVSRQAVAEALRPVNLSFQRDLLLVPVGTLEEAQRYTQAVYTALLQAEGSVATLPLASLSTSSRTDPEAVIYGTQDHGRPVMVSKRVPSFVDPWVSQKVFPSLYPNADISSQSTVDVSSLQDGSARKFS